MKTIHPSIALMQMCVDKAKEKLGKNQYALASLVADENGKVLAIQNSNLKSGFDPTAHPEIAVIRETCEKLKTRYLQGCYLYTTLEPCPMCSSAVIWAKMTGIVFGASINDAIEFIKKKPSTALSWRQIKVPSEYIAKCGTPKIKVYSNILHNKCKELFDIAYKINENDK